MKRMILDVLLVAGFLYLIAFALNYTNSDLQDARITEDRVTELGKQYRTEQKEMKKQEKVLRAQAALYTGVK